MTCNLIDLRVGHLKLRVPPQQVLAPSKLEASSPLGKLVQPSEGSFLVTMTSERTLRNVSLRLCSFPLRIIAPLCLDYLAHSRPSLRHAPSHLRSRPHEQRAYERFCSFTHSTIEPSPSLF